MEILALGEELEATRSTQLEMEATKLLSAKICDTPDIQLTGGKGQEACRQAWADRSMYIQHSAEAVVWARLDSFGAPRLQPDCETIVGQDHHRRLNPVSLNEDEGPFSNFFAGSIISARGAQAESRRRYS